MNNKILAEIEMNRKIYLFQKAVEQYVSEKTLKNAQRVVETKSELLKFAEVAA